MASGGRRRKPRWGSRPKKARKAKYLSLSRIIVKTEEVGTPPEPEDARSPSPPHEEEEVEVKVKTDDGGGGGNHEAEPPFALHHEASTLFEAVPAPSLSEILGAAASDESPSSADPEFPDAEVKEEEEEDLARRALRGRERWVYCSNSSSSPSSSSSPCSSSAASTGSASASAARPALLLKLDYGEILAAWADRGPLYIGHHHAAPHPDPPPELGDNSVQVLVEVEVKPAQHPLATACATETWRDGRAESVRRYKEKRRNRLFAHRVRYEVRRVNAVKRPRFKGRFVKEHGEMEIEAT